MNPRLKRIVQLSAIVAAAGFFGVGCSTYKSENQVLNGHWQKGEIGLAQIEAGRKAADAKGSKNCVVWHLESGTVLRAASEPLDSNCAFEIADDRMTKYDEGAKVKIAGEGVALMTNQANLPYEGRVYDKIMLCTYKALNYLELDDREKARVEFNRARQRQEDAVEINKARIEKEEAAIAKEKKGKEAAEKAKEDPKLKAKLDETYAFLDQYKAESNYKNPAAVYLQGLFFMANATGPADYEIAKHSFDELTGMLGDHKWVKQDRELLGSLMNGKPVPPVTYVLFETGSAPFRDQIRIDLPLFLAGIRGVPYAGAAFPTLKFSNGHVPELQITAGPVTEKTITIANMDAIIARDFKNELPRIITKTMVSTLAKAAAAYAVNEAARQQSSYAYLGSMIATTVYQAAVNIADTRTWTTLPKEIQICRVPTPADRKITLATPDGTQRGEITVNEGVINLVSVRSINPATRLLISQCKLK